MQARTSKGYNSLQAPELRYLVTSRQVILCGGICCLAVLRTGLSCVMGSLAQPWLSKFMHDMLAHEWLVKSRIRIQRNIQLNHASLHAFLWTHAAYSGVGGTCSELGALAEQGAASSARHLKAIRNFVILFGSESCSFLSSCYCLANVLVIAAHGTPSVSAAISTCQAHVHLGCCLVSLHATRACCFT